MNVRTLALAVLALTVATNAAFAHPPPLGITGFSGGLLHPAFVPAHLLALVACGLLIGQQTGWSRAALIAFLAGIGSGLIVMTFGVVPTLMNELVMTLAVAASLMVAFARPIPEAAGAVLVAVAGFCIALDSPPEAVAVSEANRMLLGTGVGAAVLLLLPAWGTQQLQSAWSRVGVRVLGSWIAASAILFLALRLVR